MDIDKLKAILAVLKGTEVTRLTWEDEKEKISVSLAPRAPAATASASSPALAAAAIPTPPPVAPAPTSAAPPAAPERKSFTVNSPFVGTFYRSASPDAPPFADVGQVVRKGQVLCIVEAMKLMNEIEAEQPGRLVEVLVQNASPVEYGEALFRFEPV